MLFKFMLKNPLRQNINHRILLYKKRLERYKKNKAIDLIRIKENYSFTPQQREIFRRFYIDH